MEQTDPEERALDIFPACGSGQPGSTHGKSMYMILFT